MRPLSNRGVWLGRGPLRSQGGMCPSLGINPLGAAHLEKSIIRPIKDGRIESLSSTNHTMTVRSQIPEGLPIHIPAFSSITYCVSRSALTENSQAQENNRQKRDAALVMVRRESRNGGPETNKLIYISTGHLMNPLFCDSLRRGGSLTWSGQRHLQPVY